MSISRWTPRVRTSNPLTPIRSHLPRLSPKTLDALEQANENYQSLEMAAIHAIDDDALHVQSTHGADALYRTERGDLTVHVRLIGQSQRYDLISINPPTASTSLSVPPPASTPSFSGSNQ